MYTKQDFLAAMEREIAIIKHLYSKVEKKDLVHQFTEKQRTIHELLQFLAMTSWFVIKAIVTGDGSHYAHFNDTMKAIDVDHFPQLMDQEMTEAKALLSSVSEDDLEEPVTLFGSFTNRKIVMLVEFVLSQLVAYKMQLFLQLKHAGKHQLVTSNLWMGVDPKTE